jgi:hypothetical protein
MVVQFNDTYFTKYYYDDEIIFASLTDMTNLYENSKQMYILDTFPIDKKNLNMHRFIEKGRLSIQD